MELPKGLVLAKPIAQESYDESVIYDLERHDRLVITRKRDGWKILVHFDRNGEPRLYTDGLNEIDSRLDHIKSELKKLGFPPNTLAVGEGIVDVDDNDDLTKVISIFHSNLARSLQLQETYGKINFMLFGAVSCGLDETFHSLGRSFLAVFRAKSVIEHRRLRYVSLAPILRCNFDQAKRIVVEKGWEGLVLYDKSYGLAYRLDGRAPKRPRGCYKWKPILEDDFIIRERIFRPNKEVLKEVVLLQIDPVSGKEFECGKLSSFSAKMLQRLGKVKLPIVVQARFEMRFPKSGKIRNARFVQVRIDKPINQCIAPKSYPEEKVISLGK